MKHSSSFIVILYDSITNTVFESQVLLPLVQQRATNPTLSIILISFEPNPEQVRLHAQRLEQDYHLTIIIYKRLMYVGLATLYYAAHTLKSIINAHAPCHLITRGPYAGFIGTQLLPNHPNCTLTVQARGLLYEEFCYTHTPTNFLQSLMFQLRAWLYKNLEKRVYTNGRYTIEAVSPALAEYLIATFSIDPTKITIAHHDIPQPFSQELVLQWRQTSRKMVSIAPDAYVYCYNGSAKPWQCPDLVISFFVDQLKQNPHSFLLILTQDQEPFYHLARTAGLSNKLFTIITVPHTELYQYLAAADAGLLFRQPHTINWTSRPTKVLEYKAVGLPIIHNNTVAWLIQDQPYASPLVQNQQKADGVYQNDF